ncbi:MAG: hypothetical protein AAF065_00290 [Verrucomicrobiota bacterium]
MKPGLSGDSDRGGRAKLFSPVLRWALLLGVLVHLAGFWLFRVVSNSLPERLDQPPFLSFLDDQSLIDDVGLEEQAMLFDTAPLFIPGYWSAASAALPQQLNPASNVFSDFEPEIDLLAELQPPRIFLSGDFEVEEPEDLLDLRFWRLFQHFGQRDTIAPAFENWEAFAEVEVIDSSGANTGDEVRTYSVDFEPSVTVSVAERPVIFHLGVSMPGLPIGRPVMKQSSGVNEVDVAAERWLLRPDVLGSMPAGYLEVRCYL